MNLTYKKGAVCIFCNTTQTKEGIYCEKCNKTSVLPERSLPERIGREIVMSAAKMIGAVKDEPVQQKVNNKPVELFSSSIIKLPGIIALFALIYSLIHLLQNPAKPFLNPNFFIFSNIGIEVAVVSFAGAVLFFLLRNQSLARTVLSTTITIFVLIRPLLYLIDHPDNLSSFFKLYLHSDNIEALLWGGGFFLFSVYINRKLKKSK